MYIVEKPWGRELWLAHDNGRYAGKILEIKKGHRLSLQYHEFKHETMYLMEGKLKFSLQNDQGDLVEAVMEQGETRIVRPHRKHRMEAIEDSKIFEVSTPELDDVVRISDDYTTDGERV